MTRSITAVIAITVAVAEACLPRLYPTREKVREYKQALYAEPDEARTAGSLWSEGAHGLFEDARARRVGDIVTIRVDERSDATRDASTATARNSETSLGISSFAGALEKLAASMPELDPAKLIGAASAASFDGSGSTKRSGVLTATLPVRIKAVLPNGDYYIEGNKVLLLNDEESFLYISGVTRPIDIDADNSISSAMLADVELEYTGRGVLSERQSPGWLARVLDVVWPF